MVLLLGLDEVAVFCWLVELCVVQLVVRTLSLGARGALAVRSVAVGIVIGRFRGPELAGGAFRPLAAGLLMVSALGSKVGL